MNPTSKLPIVPWSTKCIIALGRSKKRQGLIHSKMLFPLLLLLLGLASFSTQAAEPLYQKNFEQTEIGGVPSDFLVLDGNFEVKEEDGKKYLELAGAPLDSFCIIFGPSAKYGNEISARIFGTKKGRRYPVFGVALNGVNGYRLQVAPAKRSIELLKGTSVIANTAFRWSGGSWLNLSLNVLQTANNEWTINGRVWEEGKKAPTSPTLTHKEMKEPRNGKPSIWGSPFSGTPIRYDDIVVRKMAN